MQNTNEIEGGSFLSLVAANSLQISAWSRAPSICWCLCTEIVLSYSEYYEPSDGTISE